MSYALSVKLVIGAIVAISVGTIISQTGSPVEVGDIQWRSVDLEAAQADSKQTGKPILMLFQEVPG